MSETTITFENLMDALTSITDPLPTQSALYVLTSAIMRTTGECEDPTRALLAVIAELTQIVRFAEHGRQEGTALTLDEWIKDAWQE